MLSVMEEELPDVPLYIVHDKVFSVVGAQTGKMQRFMSALLNAGYRYWVCSCK